LLGLFDRITFDSNLTCLFHDNDVVKKVAPPPH